jgi:hypothetical protein
MEIKAIRESKISSPARLRSGNLSSVWRGGVRALWLCGDQVPIFEHTSLFSRSIGDTTDIVEKEMYSFEDQGGEQLT